MEAPLFVCTREQQFVFYVLKVHQVPKCTDGCQCSMKTVVCRNRVSTNGGVLQQCVYKRWCVATVCLQTVVCRNSVSTNGGVLQQCVYKRRCVATVCLQIVVCRNSVYKRLEKFATSQQLKDMVRASHVAEHKICIPMAYRRLCDDDRPSALKSKGTMPKNYVSSLQLL
jgi:hypothetical protein